MSKVNGFVQNVGGNALAKNMAFAVNFTKGFTKNQQKQIKRKLEDKGLTIKVCGKDAMVQRMTTVHNLGDLRTAGCQIIAAELNKVFFPIMKSAVTSHTAASGLGAKALTEGIDLRDVIETAKLMSKAEIQHLANETAKRL